MRSRPTLPLLAFLSVVMLPTQADAQHRSRGDRAMLAATTGIGTVAPHVGIAWHHTARRGMMPFTTGLAVFGDDTFMRLDVALLHGTPKLGMAFGLGF